MPVVDDQKRLVGMVTMKELLDGNGVYLPTAVKLLSSLHVIHGEDIASVDQKLQALKKLRARDVMKRKPLYLLDTASLEKAAEAFVLRHEEVLPVVNYQSELVGLVSKNEILKCLIDPLEAVNLHPDLIIEPEKSSVIDEVGEKFVMVSRGRARFWYGTVAVFFLIGIIIALSIILRIRVF